MVVGASGGSTIVSSVAQTVIRSLLFNQTIKEAIDGPRLHNQFIPHSTTYETTIPKVCQLILENVAADVVVNLPHSKNRILKERCFHTLISTKMLLMF